MEIFFISIPLTFVAVGIAVVPLIAVSQNEWRDGVREAEQRIEQPAVVHLASAHLTART